MGGSSYVGAAPLRCLFLLEARLFWNHALTVFVSLKKNALRVTRKGMRKGRRTFRDDQQELCAHPVRDVHFYRKVRSKQLIEKQNDDDEVSWVYPSADQGDLKSHLQMEAKRQKH